MTLAWLRRSGWAGVALAALLIGAAPVTAATMFYVQGGGDGHGIGMSQYGAYGYAQHGKDYRFILGHYYTGASLGTISGPRNFSQLTQGNLCTPSSDSGCPPRRPRPIH